MTVVKEIAMRFIGQEEFKQRVERLRDCLRQHDYDAFVATTADTLFYLTGALCDALERPVLLIVPVEGAPVLITPIIEQGPLAAQVPWAELQVYREYPATEGKGWESALERAVGKSKRLATEPYTRGEILAPLGGRVELESFIEQLRLIKSPAEIALIRRAAQFCDRYVETMRNCIGVGTTVADVYAETAHIASAMADELGNSYSPFSTTSMAVPWCAPENSEPHRLPQPDDTFRDAGPHNLTAIARYAGYSAESERIFTLAPLPGPIADMARTVVDARKLAWSMLRPGCATSEIDVEVSGLIKSRGYEDYWRHRTGHGFGLGGHEGPWLAEGAQDILAPNMVVSVEPGLYIPEVGGIRDSDTILITDDGFELLTREPYLAIP